MSRVGRADGTATGKALRVNPRRAQPDGVSPVGPPSPAMTALLAARRAWDLYVSPQLTIFSLVPPDAEGGASGPVLRTP